MYILLFSILLYPLPPSNGEITPADCQSPLNLIIAENCLLGNDSTEWDVNADGDPSIQGFATQFSINKGDIAHFKVKTDSSDYRIDIFRVGYYGGAGARQVDTILPSVALPQQQPDCYKDPDTLLYDCGAWEVSASWEVPGTAVSGVYLARLVRRDGGRSWRQDNSQYPADKRFSYPDDIPGYVPSAPLAMAHAYGALGHGKLANALKEPQASLIYFVVRDDDRMSDVIFQTSDTTWQAYNMYGGANTYYGINPPYRRAYKVSYNRPFQTRATRAVNILFGAEYPMIRWLEANGYDVSYQAGVDTDRNPVEMLKNHRLFLSVGHDEYWSGEQRRKVEQARDEGVNLAFFSGNEVFWRIRWENDHRHLVVYKESQEKVKKDPVVDEWTGIWRDSRPINPLGPQPENSLTGTIFTVNAWRNDALEVPPEFQSLRFWRHTGVAELGRTAVIKPGVAELGRTAVIKPGLLGHEWDEDLDNGFRPGGLVRVSSTTVNNVWMLQDFNVKNCDSGTATHSLVMYRAKSGALVFGAGTVQWSWGLDPYRDTETGVPPERANPTNIRVGRDQMGAEPDIQQATLNLLTDMGVYVGVQQLSEGLTFPDPTEDFTPPVVSIKSIDSPEVHELSLVGEAKDVGGVVAAVEYSIDEGLSWHPAQFRPIFKFSLDPTKKDLSSWEWNLQLSRSSDPDQLGVFLNNDSSKVVVCVRAVDDSYNIGKQMVVNASWKLNPVTLSVSVTTR